MFTDYLTNLSKGGIRINSYQPVGEEIWLNLKLPNSNQSFDVLCIVRWSYPEGEDVGAASGLEFLTIDKSSEELIGSLLDDIESAGKSRAAMVFVLFESNETLRDAYAQEINNWSELNSTDVEMIVLSELDELLVLDESKFDLIIADCDSMQASRLEIEKLQLKLNKPLILLSNRPDNDAKQNQIFLKKPLDFGSLMNAIHFMISHKAVLK